MRIGTVLAGATFGTLVSLIHADVHDGNDARLISTYALAGAALGGVVQLAWDRHLYPRVPPSTPQVGMTPDGGVFLGMTFRF